jgi:hypothetical protein
MVEIAIKKLKRQKSPSNDQIPVKLIKSGYEILCSEIHKLINKLFIVGCRRLLIQYILNYPPYLKAITGCDKQW